MFEPEEPELVTQRLWRFHDDTDAASMTPDLKKCEAFVPEGASMRTSCGMDSL